MKTRKLSFPLSVAGHFLLLFSILALFVGCAGQEQEKVPVADPKTKVQASSTAQNCAEKLLEQSLKGTIPFINTLQTTVDDGAESFNFWLRDGFSPGAYWGIYGQDHQLQALKMEKTRGLGQGDVVEVLTTIIGRQNLELRYRRVRGNLPTLHFVQKYALTGAYPNSCDLSINSVERVDFAQPPMAEREVKKLKMVAGLWRPAPEVETTTESYMDLNEEDLYVDLVGFYFPRTLQALGNARARIFDLKSLSLLNTKLLRGEDIQLRLPPTNRPVSYATYRWITSNPLTPGTPAETKTLYISSSSREMALETTDSTEVFMTEAQWKEQTLR